MREPADVSARVQQILRWLESRGTQRNREGMARYGIRSARAFGVSMETMRPLVRNLGRDHRLALALWETGWHEARVLAAFVDDPAAVTPAQMESWVADFDNWAVCDSTCIHLFDRTPYAVAKVRQWSRRRPEFVRRAAFALIAGLAVHDRNLPDEIFLGFLPLIERAADDDRHFVKKAVSWALRQMGKRSRTLHAPAIALARALAERHEPSARWIGRDALRELSSAAVVARLDRRALSDTPRPGLRTAPRTGRRAPSGLRAIPPPRRAPRRARR